MWGGNGNGCDESEARCVIAILSLSLSHTQVIFPGGYAAVKNGTQDKHYFPVMKLRNEWVQCITFVVHLGKIERDGLLCHPGSCGVQSDMGHCSPSGMQGHRPDHPNHYLGMTARLAHASGPRF